VTPTTLAELLELERLDRDLFRGENEPGARERHALYGGQVAAQALRAAGTTVADDRVPHSFHGYFLRPGRVDRPVIFEVDRDRDGGAFSARHVRAVQEGEVIFSMLASFHEHRDSPTFDVLATSDAPGPDSLAPRPTVASLVEVREVTPTRIVGRQFRHPDRIWVRASAPLPDDVLAHACALAYASDLGSGFGQTEIPGLPTSGPSIDHAVWFHAPLRADDWMLLELAPRKARSSRGVYDGSLRNLEGELGALIAQEMLLRDVVFDDETLRRVAEFLDVTPED
jgi:acyl-CoA thioesterase-2